MRSRAFDIFVLAFLLSGLIAVGVSAADDGPAVAPATASSDSSSLGGFAASAFCRITGGSGCTETFTTTTYSATTNLDFSASSVTSVTLTGDITFTTSNLASGRSLLVRVVGDGSIRNLTFPVTWIPVGTALPATLAANKAAFLTLTSFSTTDALVYAAWSPQP